MRLESKSIFLDTRVCLDTPDTVRANGYSPVHIPTLRYQVNSAAISVSHTHICSLPKHVANGYVTT